MERGIAPDYSRTVAGLNDEPGRFVISDALIASLVHEQFAHLGSLEVGRRYVFDDHITVRLGDRLSANLPTVADVDPLVKRSGRWLLAASSRWTFPAGIPILTGVPSDDYPYHWEICRWLPGSNTTIVDLAADGGIRLGRALREIHRPAPADAPASPRASASLGELDPEWETTLATLVKSRGPQGEVIDPGVLVPLWRAGLDADANHERVWVHGNLDPRYVVSEHGRFGGICTWFTFGFGDPAADLGAACLLLPATEMGTLCDGYGPVDEATIHRAHAFRLLIGATYATSPNPLLSRLGWDRLREMARAKRTSPQEPS